jgi:hypothetical protein
MAPPHMGPHPGHPSPPRPSRGGVGIPRGLPSPGRPGAAPGPPARGGMRGLESRRGPGTRGRRRGAPWTLWGAADLCAGRGPREAAPGRAHRCCPSAGGVLVGHGARGQGRAPRAEGPSGVPQRASGAARAAGAPSCPRACWPWSSVGAPAGPRRPPRGRAGRGSGARGATPRTARAGPAAARASTRPPRRGQPRTTRVPPPTASAHEAARAPGVSPPGASPGLAPRGARRRRPPAPPGVPCPRARARWQAWSRRPGGGVWSRKRREDRAHGRVPAPCG